MAELKMRFRYCISFPGMLKWLEIVFAIVVLGLVLWEAWEGKDLNRKYIIDGEEYTAVVGAICVVANAAFLIIFFLNCHMGPCVGCHCFRFASAYYFLSILMWLAAAGVEVYATTKFKDWSETPIFGKSYEKYYHRRAAASAFCFANALLFAASLQQAKYQDL